MIPALCILALVAVIALKVYDRRKGPAPIKRRDLRALRRDIKSWQNGAQPKLRENEE